MTLEREDVYDREIAPLMTQIIDVCKKNEIPMFATFEYSPEAFCTTVLPDETGENSITFQMIRWAALCHGNADRLIMTLLKHAEKHGHQSVYLSLLEKDLGLPSSIK